MQVWPLPPDWSNGIQERLAWLTEILRAETTGATVHRSLRLGPRRSFTFEVVACGNDRSILDMLVARHGGEWLLPIWPDASWLGSDLPGGAIEVRCDTTGRDFVVSGKALLHSSIGHWELVDVAGVHFDRVAFAAPTTASFSAGDRLYPLRLARLQDGAREELLSDLVSRRELTFDITESSSFPAWSNPSTYRGHPVLVDRPDETTNLTGSYSRLGGTVDFDTSHPWVHDLAGLGLRTQQAQWTILGREEHSAFRSMLYALAGRAMPIWVPSWAADIVPLGTVPANGTTLRIANAGYTRFGLNQPNRRDLRIELFNGTTLYRRVVGATELEALELLVLDQPLDTSAIPAAQIRLISFLALSTLSSDEVEIDHITDADGVAQATLSWQAVVPDVG